MISCPLCLTEFNFPSPTRTWISCECGRLAYNKLSNYWRFSVQFGVPEFMEVRDGLLRACRNGNLQHVPENGRATFVRRFVDRVLTREVLES